MQHQEVTAIIAIDFSAAFNTVDPEILLYDVQQQLVFVTRRCVGLILT